MRNALLLSFCLVTASASAQGGHDWRSYANARFDYSICYPADLLVPQREADNSDGRAFTGADGAKLLVYGSYSAVDEAVPQAAASHAQSLGRVTYRVVTARGFVLSGRKGGDIFYEKTDLVGDAYKTFILTYPARASGVYNVVAARLAGCFRTK